MLKFFRKKKSAKPVEDRPEDTLPDGHEAAVPGPSEQTVHAAERLFEPSVDDALQPPRGVSDADVVEPANDSSDVADERADETRGRSWRSRLSGSAFALGVGSIFERNPRLDDALLDELETVLITADVGVDTTTQVCENLRTRMHKRAFADAAALRQALREMLIERLQPVQQALDISDAAPYVVLVVGINGVGKTTTIGKLARHARNEGLAVMLAAGDTFRAAAVQQLQTWGERNSVPVVSQGQDADAASVVFDALQSARARGADLLIADTAGRLHTQAGLMDELGKIARVLKKIDPSAPHEVLMVIDGSTGQNAVSQVRKFRDMVDVTGLVVTKLDGTAKGGVVFALASEFGLPIRFVGLGEGIDDLRVFDAQRYVDGLLPAGAVTG